MSTHNILVLSYCSNEEYPQEKNKEVLVANFVRYLLVVVMGTYLTCLFFFWLFPPTNILIPRVEAGIRIFL